LDSTKKSATFKH